MVIKNLLRFLGRAFGVGQRHKKKRRPSKHLRKKRPSRKTGRRSRPVSRPRKIRRAKKSTSKKTPKRHAVAKQKPAHLVGEVTHYFPKVRAAVVKCRSTLAIGQAIWVKGATTDFRQTVGSLQIDREPIEKAKKGQTIGLEVFKDVRPGDKVYLS